MPTILIVDDLEENRYLLETLLEGNGYQVMSAANGMEAKQMALRAPPSLIIADILMPVMDGYSLCRQWKADARLKHIPFVFYTATYTDSADKAFALGLGADRFIIKPQDPDVFLDFIRETLSEYEAGALTPARAPSEKESIQLEKYNQVLVRKLESKIMQLEKIRAELKQDVEARIQAEATLQESFQFLQATLDAVPLALCILDANGKVQLGNAAWRTLLQVTALPQMEGWMGSDFLASWETAVREETIGQSQSLTKELGDLLGTSRCSFELELSWVYPTGTGWFLSRGWPFTVQHKNFSTLTFEDVTRVKESQLAFQESSERHRTLARGLTEVQETERHRLALELHDAFGQSLTALKLGVYALLHLTAKDAREKQGAMIMGVIAQQIDRVRQLSLNLRPSMLDDLGLLPVLKWLVEGFTNLTGVQVSFSSNLGETRLLPNIELTAFRMVQESLTNIQRHASASHVRVEANVESDHLSLLVQDDGVGFVPEEAFRLAKTGKCIGLLGMKERLAWIQGELTITSQPGQGCQVMVTIPFDSLTQSN